jgi:hypothetical protein
MFCSTRKIDRIHTIYDLPETEPLFVKHGIVLIVKLYPILRKTLLVCFKEFVSVSRRVDVRQAAGRKKLPNLYHNMLILK